MRELLFNENMSEEDLIEWGERYNTTGENDYICLIINIEKNPKANLDLMRLKDVIAVAVQKISPSMLIGIIRGKICMIQHVDAQQNLHQVIEATYNIVKKIVEQTMTIHIGVGEVCQGIKGIRKSFYQAEQAVKLTGMSKDIQPIIYYKELGAYRLLEPLKDSQELADFYANSIDKLVAEDMKGELIHTLQTYFYEDEVLKATAKKLFIHVNTLKYRMKRIEEITGLAFRKSEDKLNLFLGLKIYVLMHKT